MNIYHDIANVIAKLKLSELEKLILTNKINALVFDHGLDSITAFQKRIKPNV